MTESRESLGKSRHITRRDFLDGVAISGAAVLASGGALGSLVAGRERRPEAPYPPALTGLRGSHPGSFEAAHALRDGTLDFSSARDTGESYDLVVVGAGISGLAAAYFFRQREPGARILILDNHDDFGGHAKRNEFRSARRVVLGYGGAQSLENPSQYSAVAKGLLRELGVELGRFAGAFDQKLYPSLGLEPAVFFGAGAFGRDQLCHGFGRKPWRAFLAEAPLGEEARRDIERLYSSNGDYLAGRSPEEKRDLLTRTCYSDFLTRYAGVTAAALPFFQAMTHDSHGVGIEAVPALDCWATRVFIGGLGEGLAYPGFGGLGLERQGAGALSPTAALQQHEEPYIYHFPDGNAGVARLLVRALIPEAARGGTMEDAVGSRFHYDRLEGRRSPVRLRLRSTCVRVRPRVGATEVTYVRGAGVETVAASRVVLACWNGMIPYLLPELPEAQQEALRYGVKVPLVYSNVLIREWSSFADLGIDQVYAPGSYHTAVSLDFPVSMGGYRFPSDPREPMMLHMMRTPCSPGLPARMQHRAGRAELLSTSFETFEREIRDQLGRMLGAGGFDPDRDIQAITVNRWSHGYAYEYNSLFDPEWPDGEAPHQLGRRRFGRIAIANSDAGASAYMDTAIDEAHRAVGELFAA